MTAKILIYGATGYTGKLVSEQARHAGLDFAIAGRNEEKFCALARRLGGPYHVLYRHGEDNDYAG